MTERRVPPLAVWSRRALVIPILVIALLLATGTGLVSAQEATPDVTEPGDEPQQDAQVIVVHASPDAGNVDVYVDGDQVLTDVAFGTFNDPPLGVVGGDHQIQVVPTGADPVDAVIDEELTLEAGTTYEVAAVGPADDIQAQVYEVNVAPVAEGQARVRVVHNSADAGPVDVAVTGGDVLFEGVEFPNASDYLEVEAGIYDLEVRPAGTEDVALSLPGTELNDRRVYDVFAIGNAADGTLTALPISLLIGSPQAVSRPAHIHQGSCDNLDPNPLFPLEDVILTEGEADGNDDARRVETSFSTVPVDLATILAEDHAINVHESQDNVNVYVACGEIGGVTEPDGSIVIGLREQNGSGLNGVAILLPNAADPATTDVSVYLARQGGGSESDVATPAAGVADDAEATPST